MRRFVFSFVLLALALTQSRAQLGLEAGMLQTQLDEWAAVTDEAASTSFAEAAAGRFLTLSYWFRLRPVRIEFSPGIRFAHQVFWLSPNEARPLAIRSVSAEGPVLVYPFDLGSDCDCPTFSKQGPALEKGLFLALVPAWQWQQYLPSEEDTASKGSQMLPSLAVRLGLDIGLSDAWTVTFQGGLHLDRAWEWAGFPALFPDHPDAPARTTARGWHAGMVIRYRWKR